MPLPRSPGSQAFDQALFSYGDPVSRPGVNGHFHEGPFAIIDVETTGLSPRGGDRVVEIAIARVQPNGKIEDEFATLVNPEGRDTGPVFIHGISNDAVRDAPLFSEIVGDVLARLEGAVVVAHNAAFEERFLVAEFSRLGIAPAPLPALCSLALSQRTFNTPNHKLSTLARHFGIPLVDAHAALGDVRAVATLMPTILQQHTAGFVYPHPVAYGLTQRLTVGACIPKTRAVALRKGTDGWMASLMARLPMSAAEATTAEAIAYLDALASALEDGKVVGEEAKHLAKLAGAAGLGARQVAELNERFLENMREAALADEVLTSSELRELNRAAAALGVPDYFDDLTLHPAVLDLDDGGSDEAVKAQKTQAARAPRRCGHCRTPGHYRNNCPDLR